MSGSIFDSLNGMTSNPGVMALLGAAQGFGNAAMPTPYKGGVPMGAALGMAAGGLAQGAQNAYANQMAQQKAQMGQLQLQQAKAMQPYMLQLNQSLASGTMPGSSGAPTDGSAPLIDPRLAASMALRDTLNGGRNASAWLGAVNNRLPSGGGYYVGQDGQVHVTGGANEAAGSRVSAENWGKVAPELALHGLMPNPDGSVTAIPGFGGAQGSIDAAKAWAMLPPELQKSATEAGFKVQQKAGIMPVAPGAASSSWTPVPYDPNDPVNQKALADIPKAYQPMVTAAAQKYGVPVPFIASTMRAENPNFNPLAKSSAGAIGLMQVMPGTAPGVDLTNPASNIDAGVAYLRQGLDKTGNFAGASAAYHNGAGSETAGYVGKVASNLSGYGYNPNVTPVAPGRTITNTPNGTAVTDTRVPQQQAYIKDLDELHADAETLNHLQQSQQRVLDSRNLAAQLPQTGPLGENRAKMAAWVQTYAPQSFQQWIKDTANLPDAATAQEFAKIQLQAAGMQERDAVGARGGVALTKMYKDANPSLNMVPKANMEIANLQAVAHQMDIDYLQGEQQYGYQNGQTYLQGKGNYNPIAGYDAEWSKQRNPQVYLGATYAMSGRPYNEWSKGLSNDEQKRAIGVIQRIDPTAKVTLSDGKQYTFAQAPQ